MSQVVPSSILVVGSLNLDLVVQVRHLPRPGETLQASSLSTYPGGKGANQAVAAARLSSQNSGPAVRILGRVGDDVAADRLRKALQEAGVDISAVFTTPDTPTGTALIHISSAGENSITVVAGANAKLCPADLHDNAQLIANAGMVLTQLEVPIETVICLSELCEKYDVPLILDPAPAVQLPGELLKRLKWLTPNETEAAILLGRSTPAGGPETPWSEAESDSIARELRILGASGVVLKQGARGSYLKGATEKLCSPSFAINTIDTTAAGDCFNGAFAVALTRGDNLASALEFANAAAALSTTRSGAQPSMPTLTEVQEFMATSHARR